jgi:hypothetical protein
MAKKFDPFEVLAAEKWNDRPNIKDSGLYRESDKQSSIPVANIYPSKRYLDENKAPEKMPIESLKAIAKSQAKAEYHNLLPKEVTSQYLASAAIEGRPKDFGANFVDVDYRTAPKKAWHDNERKLNEDEKDFMNYLIGKKMDKNYDPNTEQAILHRFDDKLWSPSKEASGVLAAANKLGLNSNVKPDIDERYGPGKHRKSVRFSPKGNKGFINLQDDVSYNDVNALEQAADLKTLALLNNKSQFPKLIKTTDDYWRSFNGFGDPSKGVLNNGMKSKYDSMGRDYLDKHREATHAMTLPENKQVVEVYNSLVDKYKKDLAEKDRIKQIEQNDFSLPYPPVNYSHGGQTSGNSNMSLTHIADHLASQGRNNDTQLVHMTPNELRALNKLSLDHNGKPLSTNPKTGLPEAGFLSSLLPTIAGVAGAAMGLPTWAVIGGVGLAATALTGDIGQGIMAGLGAWSGGKLGADIANASTLTQTGADVGAKAFEATADSALKTTMEPFSETLGRTFTVDPTKEFIGQSFTPSAASSIADQAKTFIPEVSTGVANAASTAFPQGATAYTPFENFSSGLDYAKANPMSFLSRPGVGMNVASAALPGVLALMDQQQQTIPGAKEEENPFGLKRLSKDFKGSFPTQPNPYYTAQYPDYRAKPYGMNEGGLSDIDRYKSKGKVDYKKTLDSIKLMNEGISELSPSSSEFAPIIPRDPGDAMGGPGIVEYEEEYRGMAPNERALAMLQNNRKRTLKDDIASGLQSVGSLGSLDFTPAAQKQAMLEAQAKQQIIQEAKSGGLMDGHLGDYSDGGRLLKGPGDGVSDSIPATIGGKQAARLAEGEFVIPARIVSELGNGSTDAGAKRLYAMMDRVKAKRAKAKDIAADTKAYKLLPA